MTSSYKNILRAVSLFTGVQGLNLLLNLVRTKLAAMILGPAGIGLNGIFNEMRELIHSTSNIGMDVSGVREISMAYEEALDPSETGEANGTRSIKLSDAIASVRTWVVLLAMFGALICLVLSEPLSWLTFSDYSHTWDYALLAPSVAFSTLTCGEMAILKGVRRIKALATVSVLNVLAGLVTTIPIYYVWGMKGVVPALVALTAVMYVIAATYSYRIHPLKLDFKSSRLRNGIPMLAIGLSFVLSSLASHGTEIAIRSYLNQVASLHMVGLYTAGATIVISYGGMVFASLDNDYFPRLSGIFSDKTIRQNTVCNQIEVLLYIIIPLILVMILALPIAVPLLFSKDFCAVIPMTQIAALGLLFRTVYLPLGYVPLAAGDSKCFLALEITSYAIVLISLIAGYHYDGLMGLGTGLVISNLMDMTISAVFVRWRYGIRLSKKIMCAVPAATIVLGTILWLFFRYSGL